MKMPFDRLKTFFLQKFPLFIYFLFPPNSQIFWSLGKNTSNYGGKVSLKKLNCLIRILKQIHGFIEFEYVHFFSPKKPFSPKKIYFRTYFRYLAISVALRQICYDLVVKTFQIQNLGILPGQLASKRKKRHHFEWMIFLPYCRYRGKIMK